MTGNLRGQPQAVAYHIGIGNLLQGFGGPDIHIPTDNHGVDILRRPFHNLLIQRDLQREQVLF